jgi:hypothetical protein
MKGSQPMKRRVEPEVPYTDEIEQFDRSRRHVMAWVIVETFYVLSVFALLAYNANKHFFNQHGRIVDRDYFWGFMTPVILGLLTLFRVLVSLYTNRHRLVRRKRIFE